MINECLFIAQACLATDKVPTLLEIFSIPTHRGAILCAFKKNPA